MATQTLFNTPEPVESVETYEFEEIQGYPMLRWKGKRPFESTQYYPAQLKETYGEEVDDWRNKIYWGDNLQVMSHLLKTHRGKINLIYIDPPFDSKAEYKKTIQLRGRTVENDRTAFEEKQYTDIWTNDEYLQFMYERLFLMRELLADNGSIYLHCDPTMSHYLKLLMDEVFGAGNFRNEITWKKTNSPKAQSACFGTQKDSIFFYTKNTEKFIFNKIYRAHDEKTLRPYTRDDNDGKGKYRLIEIEAHGVQLTNDRKYFEFKGRTAPYLYKLETLQEWDTERRIYTSKNGKHSKKQYLNESPGILVSELWTDNEVKPIQSSEWTGYPTQKPIALLERIIKAASNPGDLVFDCFMGSGTTQAVTMKLGRRFIGADINLGAVETTTKRLTNLAAEIHGNTPQRENDSQEGGTDGAQTFYTGFEVYNVNHYDVFRNPAQAKDLLIEALEIQPLPTSGIYDGEKDGRMVKIMPINRIATRADLGELIAGFDYQAFQRRQEKNPTQPVEKLLLVCMGHEPDLSAELEKAVSSYKLEIEVMDILRQKSELEFKRESESKIVRRDGNLIIEQFYPMNLLQKLSLRKENIENWQELVESVKVDFNYDGAVMNPSVIDSPKKDELVEGTYPIPEDAGTIRVKITDLLSESLEETVE